MRRALLRNVCHFGVGFLILVVLGCAAPPKKAPEPVIPAEPAAPTKPEIPPPAIEKDPFAIIPEKYRTKAIEYEKNGELGKALQSWQIVASFNPDDGDLTRKISELRSETHAKANQHFTKGLSFYQKNSLREARKEFLLTLLYNPEHAEALSYLKNKLPGETHIIYEVKKGETLKEIAGKTYQDPQKDFLIAYFNDLGKDPRLVPGTLLKIPVLEPTGGKRTADARDLPRDNKDKEIPTDWMESSSDLKDLVGKATLSFRSKQYREAALMAEKSLEIDPANKEARELVNASYYQMGKSFSQEKKYEDALTQFVRVEPGYKDVRELIASTKKSLAETHYIRGVRFFTAEELDKAIKEWEATLSLDPNHPKARRDIENARSLLNKLKEIK